MAIAHAHRPGAAPRGRRRVRRLGLQLILTAALLGGSGCALPARFKSPERLDRGLVFVLPGIEGRSILNRNIAVGLDEGGVRGAIEIYDWTYKIPGANVLNLIDIDRNRAEASRIASRILAYRARYPGRPVHLIGHSGGAAMAVLVLEALPAGRQIDSATLLAPALSPEYDLTVALRRARFGLTNFYSNWDIGLLMVGTTVFGTADREHGSSAGAIGFAMPSDLSPPGEQLYRERLRQVGWDREMREAGASGTHVGWASKAFARRYLASQILGYEARRRDFTAHLQPDSPATSASSQ